MTTEEQALALVNEVRTEYPLVSWEIGCNLALNRAIEQREAAKQELNDFRQKVSDAVEDYMMNRPTSFEQFIIPKPKPDPLVDVAKMMGYFNTAAEHWAGDVHAALAKRGLEIRGKNDD